MKKITLLIAVIFITGLSFGQQIHNNLRKSLDQQTIVQKNSTNASFTTAYNKNILATLNETFEAIFPPAGWSQTNDWHSTTESSYSIASLATGATGEFAVFDAYYSADGTTGSLITPNLTPVAGTDVLSYSVDLVKVSTNPTYQGAGAGMYLEVSTNNGVSWTTSTTNVLASLPNYNTATSGWTTQTLSLTAYIGQTVKVRFRAVSDYGWCMPCLDNVTGPNVALPAYDVVANKSFLDFDGFDYYEAIPFDQMGVISYGTSATNAGSSPLTNVTLNVDINSGAYTAASTPIATMAAGETDTLWAQPTITTPTVFTQYDARYSLTLTQTDANPADNIGDSVTFYATPFEYLRTMELNSLLSPYSFGTGAPATTGMEYGANYQLINAAEIDSIEVYVYDAVGTPSITGKLYSIDVTGTRTLVGQTATVALVPANLPALMVLPLTTPYVATAGTLVTATVAMTTAIPADTIDIGADGSFLGDASMAGAAYLYVSGAWDWYSVTGTCPIVGIDENICNLYTTSITPTSTSICSGSSSTLTADAASSYAWASNPAGFTSTLQSPVVSPTQTTVYTVTTTNASGCTATASVTITVNTVTPTINVFDNPVCVGLCTDLQAGGGDSYSWNTGDVSAVIASCPTTTTPIPYTVTVTSGTCTATATVTVNVNPLPGVFTVTGGGAFCAGGTGTTVSIGGSETGVNYQLLVDGNPSGAAVPGTGSAILWNNLTTAGTYTVVATNATTGCVSVQTGNAVITVNANPVANADVDQSIPIGTSTTLLGAASGGSGSYSYSWLPADSLVDPNVQNPTTVNLDATTIFTLTVTDLVTGCTGTDQVTISVTGGVLSVSCPIFGIQCYGNCLPLTTAVSGGTPSYSYLWSSVPTDVTLIGHETEATPTVCPEVTTTYTILVTDGAAITASCSFDIVIDPLMILDSTVVPAICGNSDGEATVNIISGGATPFSFTWSTSPAQTSQTATGLAQGIYTVTVTDANGCTGTESVDVNCVVGIQETTSAGNISIAPNPSDGSFNMTLTGYEGKEATLFISNLVGQIIYSENLSVTTDSYSEKMNLQDLGQGIYLIKVVSDGSVKTVRLLIK
jgi:hypothetical protein